jgi:autotransporter-associated beta strand protein
LSVRNFLVGIVLFVAGSSGWAQLIISKTITENQNIPDRGQYVSSFTWTDHSGLATITDVNVGLNLSSASGTTMRLGQMYATLTFGTASEGSRVAVLLNREGVSNTSAFGSALQSLNVTLDDSAATNIYNLTSSTGTYAADGRLGVNPTGTRVAYSANQITAGLSALNGNWLSSSVWSLLVADVQAGNAAKLNSWSLQVQGSAPTSGTFDPGNGATVSGAGSIESTLTTGSGGSTTVSVASGQSLSLSGGLTGSGTLATAGSGTTVLAGNSTGFTGTVSVGGTGITEVGSTGALGGGTLVQSNGDSTVKFSAGGAFNNAISVYNVAFTANGTSLTGRTTVNNATFDVANGNTSTLSGKITGSGGVTKTGLGTLLLAGADANDFTGASAVNAGTMVLQKSSSSTVAISGSTIALNGGTLLLGQANQISDATAVTLNGGALNTAGFADQVGVLRVTANSTISGLVTSAGGVATGSDFLFSSVDLSDYSTSSGAVLTLSGVGYGQSVNLASSNYTGWSNAGNLNNFTDKIQFGSTGMKASISFNGSTGLTYITAIPEPKVYVAIGILCALVGVTEYRRRRCEKSAA